MQTIEAGFKLFEWQYETIPERNALRSAFTGRSTNYQVFVMRLEGEGLYRFVILCPLEASAEHLVGLSFCIEPIPAYPLVLLNSILIEVLCVG